jgi:hypothetical protein
MDGFTRSYGPGPWQVEWECGSLRDRSPASEKSMKQFTSLPAYRQSVRLPKRQRLGLCGSGASEKTIHLEPQGLCADVPDGGGPARPVV